mgnify:CR=1 FL=1
MVHVREIPIVNFIMFHHIEMYHFPRFPFGLGFQVLTPYITHRYINKWISRKTNGRVLDNSVITDLCLMMHHSFIFFNGMENKNTWFLYLLQWDGERKHFWYYRNVVVKSGKTKNKCQWILPTEWIRSLLFIYKNKGTNN